MIETVTMERSTYAGIPHRFEAGTPPIVEAVGLGAAVDYLTEIGLDNIHRHEQAVTGYLLEGLAGLDGVSVLGPLDPTQRGGAVSFEIAGVHPHDVAQTARQPRDRRTRRAPLRQAGPQAVRRAELDPRLVVPLHDAGRDRRARSRESTTPRTTSRWGDAWISTASTRRSSWTTTGTPTTQGLREPFEAEVHHVNPTCGDEITLRVHLDGETVTDVSYDAEGCSISQAAASVMTDLVIGQPVGKAFAAHEAFLELMQGRGKVEPDEEVLEDGIAFAGVAKFPARIKCALLSWMAFKDATAQIVAKEKS